MGQPKRLSGGVPEFDGLDCRVACKQTKSLSLKTDGKTITGETSYRAAA